MRITFKKCFNVIFSQVFKNTTLADPGGATGVHPPPPNGIQFFRFCIHFCRKAPTSEVGAPPPTGNPGSATAQGSHYYKLSSLVEHLNTMVFQYSISSFSPSHTCKTIPVISVVTYHTTDTRGTGYLTSYK